MGTSRRIGKAVRWVVSQYIHRLFTLTATSSLHSAPELDNVLSHHIIVGLFARTHLVYDSITVALQNYYVQQNALRAEDTVLRDSGVA